MRVRAVGWSANGCRFTIKVGAHQLSVKVASTPTLNIATDLLLVGLGTLGLSL